jgi:hypothetical protein
VKGFAARKRLSIFIMGFLLGLQMMLEERNIWQYLDEENCLHIKAGQLPHVIFGGINWLSGA